VVRLHQICDAALDAKLRRLPDARPHRAGAFSRPVCDAPAQPPEQGKAPPGPASVIIQRATNILVAASEAPPPPQNVRNLP